MSKNPLSVLAPLVKAKREQRQRELAEQLPRLGPTPKADSVREVKWSRNLENPKEN